MKKDDSCYDIAATNQISLSDSYSWNPALSGDRSGLYSDCYVCVGLLASTTATTSPTTTIHPLVGIGELVFGGRELILQLIDWSCLVHPVQLNVGMIASSKGEAL